MWIVCGEALMDVFAGDETASGLSLDARLGGSPFNMAVGLARLGQPVAFFGGVSTGFLGERLMRALSAEGVHLGAVQRTPAPTTLGLVGLDERGVASYAFYGDGAADRQLPLSALDALDAAVPRPWTGLQLGSYTTVVEPVAATLRALVERERGRTWVAYDPNVRLNVEPDAERWRTAFSTLMPMSSLLKVSDEDLAILRPGVSPTAFAEEALASGVSLVLVTEGARGARAWTRTAGEVARAGEAVAVQDTVGAGDTFQAATLAWLAEEGHLGPDALAALTHEALSALLRFASRAAAITCSRRGADLPRRGELAA